MSMRPGLRRLALTAHVTASVGWLGAIAGFLALAVAGLTSGDPGTVRAAHIAMETIGRYVLVPLSLASLLTGLVQSLGTPWGLFRHYWVIAKLVVNVFASIVLALYLPTLDRLAGLAAALPPTAGDGDLGALRSPSPALHSAAALVLLLGAVALSVYKPRGTTRYAAGRQPASSSSRRS